MYNYPVHVIYIVYNIQVVLMRSTYMYMYI